MARVAFQRVGHDSTSTARSSCASAAARTVSAASAMDDGL